MATQVSGYGMLDYENRKRQQPRIAHELGAGAGCLKCGPKCPGLDLHFWRKICRNCQCSKAEHQELPTGSEGGMDPGSLRIGKLFDMDCPSPVTPATTAPCKLPPSLPKTAPPKAANPNLALEWVPPTADTELAVKYLEQLPEESRPIKGSEGAVNRKRALDRQLPAHDLDPAYCTSLSDKEVERMHQYVDNVKKFAVGQGLIQACPPIKTPPSNPAVVAPPSQPVPTSHPIQAQQKPSAQPPKSAYENLRADLGGDSKDVDFFLSVMGLDEKSQLRRPSTGTLPAPPPQLNKILEDKAATFMPADKNANSPSTGRKIPPALLPKPYKAASPLPSRADNHAVPSTVAQDDDLPLPPPPPELLDSPTNTLGDTNFNNIMQDFLEFLEPERKANTPGKLKLGPDSPFKPASTGSDAPFKAASTSSSAPIQGQTRPTGGSAVDRTTAAPLKDVNANAPSKPKAERLTPPPPPALMTSIPSSVEPTIGGEGVIPVNQTVVVDPSQATPTWVCRGCEKALTPGEMAIFAERAGGEACWHPQCFTCHTCHELLADLIYFFVDGHVFCGRHYAERVNMPRCKACDELIFAREYTEAEGATWHTDHFCCLRCDTPLAGHKYTPIDGQPHCLPCYQKHYGQDCKGCGQAIAPDQARVKHADWAWHASDKCFHCTHCAKSLLDQQFLIKGEAIFCSRTCATA